MAGRRGQERLPLLCHFGPILHSFHWLATCISAQKFRIIRDESRTACIATAERIYYVFFGSFLASFRPGRRRDSSRLAKTILFSIWCKSKKCAICARSEFV